MSLVSVLKVLGRLSGSTVLSFALFFAILPIRTVFALQIWLLPGKTVAPIVAAIVPHSWVIGDPSDENYWDVVSVGGFVILCGILFWAALIFGVWQWVSIHRHRSKTASVA